MPVRHDEGLVLLSRQVSQLDSLRGGSDGWIIFRMQRRVEGVWVGWRRRFSR